MDDQRVEVRPALGCEDRRDRRFAVGARGEAVDGLGWKRDKLPGLQRGGGDFVVLGSHGHGVLGGLLLGSVAEGMVRKATVPTLIVPASQEK